MDVHERFHGSPQNSGNVHGDTVNPSIRTSMEVRRGFRGRVHEHDYGRVRGRPLTRAFLTGARFRGSFRGGSTEVSTEVSTDFF